MISMTEKALSAVRSFTAHPRLEESSGVRIAEESANPRLQVRAVRRPEPGDLTVERAGGRLYLDPTAAERVRGKVLDVRTDDAGRIEFLLNAA